MPFVIDSLLLFPPLLVSLLLFIRFVMKTDIPCQMQGSSYNNNNIDRLK